MKKIFLFAFIACVIALAKSTKFDTCSSNGVTLETPKSVKLEHCAKKLCTWSRGEKVTLNVTFSSKTTLKAADLIFKVYESGSSDKIENTIYNLNVTQYYPKNQKNKDKIKTIRAGNEYVFHPTIPVESEFLHKKYPYKQFQIVHSSNGVENVVWCFQVSTRAAETTKKSGKSRPKRFLGKFIMRISKASNFLCGILNKPCGSNSNNQQNNQQ